jgi:hypothetical protein
VASDFDPRFDPAFQRGFDGVSPRVESQPTRVEPVETSAPGRPMVEGVETARATRVEPVETSPEALPPTLRGNPFIPALWIVSAVFTAAGVAAQFLAQRINYSPTAPTAAQEYVLPAVLSALSPWLFAAGLAAGIATLAIHALRWRPAE